MHEDWWALAPFLPIPYSGSHSWACHWSSSSFAGGTQPLPLAPHHLSGADPGNKLGWCRASGSTPECRLDAAQLSGVHRDPVWQREGARAVGPSLIWEMAPGKTISKLSIQLSTGAKEPSEQPLRERQPSRKERKLPEVSRSDIQNLREQKLQHCAGAVLGCGQFLL